MATDPSSCLAGCGFFGNPATEGYCSSCYRNVTAGRESGVAPEEALNHAKEAKAAAEAAHQAKVDGHRAGLRALACHEDRVEGIIKEISALPKEECQYPQVNAILGDAKFTRDQARRVAVAAHEVCHGKDAPLDAYYHGASHPDEWMIGHVVYCRVVEYWLLGDTEGLPWLGTAGYYHIEGELAMPRFEPQF